MALQIWCLQCGEESRPQPSVGVDEDGEPACMMHAVKRNDPEIQTTKTKLDAIRRPAPTAQCQIAQPVKETSMERSAAVFAKKVCACGCGQEFMPTGAASKFFPGHKPKYKPANVAKGSPKKSAIKTGADQGLKATKAEPLGGLVDLGKLKCDLLAKLAALELVAKALREV
jgi:outer membrane biosynthesis protein TonB